MPFIGKKLGETIDGSVVGMAGKQLLIAGGSDKDGFPMRRNVHGGVRVNIVVSESVGFHPTREGERQRKTIRGSVITEDIVQVNVKVLEKEKAKKAEKAEKPKKPKKMKAETAEEQVEEAKPKEAIAETEEAKNP